MSTKESYFEKNILFNTISNHDPQYSNLSLNQNSKYSTANLIQSKGGDIHKKDIVAGYCSDSYISQLRNSADAKLSWNKDDKRLKPFEFLNLYNEQKLVNENWDQRSPSTSINNDTLSLHIASYENFLKEARGGGKVMEEKTRKNVKDLLTDSFKLKNPFEFPRQQENQQSNNPGVMQFKSSQRLRNPSRDRDVNSFYAKLDDHLKDNFDKTSGELHWIPKGIIERSALIAATTKFMAPVVVSQFIDAGSYGSVFECRIAECRQPCIMKTLTNFFNTKEIKAELDALLLRTRCPFFPKFLYSGFNKQSCFCFMMECLSGGTLFEHIKNPALTSDGIRVIALHIAKAVSFLHKNHYTHGDLKAENVGLTVHGIAKIMDFGKSRNISTPAVLPNGTYDAPEVIKGEPADGAADWFSFGCMIGLVIQKVQPFFHEDTTIMQNQILNGEPIIRIEDATTKQFIKGLLEKDPKKRLTSVLEHEYLNIKTQPIFCPGDFLKQKFLQSLSAPKEEPLAAESNKQINDFIINEGLIRFPTKKCVDWMNAN